MLAGVGQVTLVADGPAAAHAGGNFLIPTAAATAAEPAATVAARTLQEMNPLVRVAALPGGEAEVDQAAAVTDANSDSDDPIAVHDLVVWCGAPTAMLRASRVDAACRARGRLFMAAATSGHAGFCFCDFGPAYTYRPKENEQGGGAGGGAGEKKKNDNSNGTTGAPPSQEQTAAFSMLSAALAAPLGGLHANAHPLFPVLCAIAAVERRAAEQGGGKEQEQATAGEAGAEAVARELEAGSLGSSPGGKALLDAALDLARAYVGQAAKIEDNDDADTRARKLVMREYAPVAAVVGATAANAALRAVSRSGHPLRNTFFYSAADGRGLVEDQPAMAEALAASGGKAGGGGAAAGGAAAAAATAAAEVVLD